MILRTPIHTHTHWDPQQYAEQARFVSELGLPVVELLAPQPGERILDLGCGDGALTRQLRELGCHIVGVDSSAEMVKAAQALGLDARLVDGHALPFVCEFDAVFTNAVLHWMTRPDAVLRSVWRALKPGGRFVGECGGYGNIATVIAALAAALAERGIDAQSVNPWYFPSAEDYRGRLEAHGFVVGTMTLFPRPTPLSDDISGWLETFAQAFLVALPAAQRAVVLAEVIELCRPKLCDAHGHWTADYVRLRFSATKPVAASGLISQPALPLAKAPGATVSAQGAALHPRPLPEAYKGRFSPKSLFFTGYSRTVSIPRAPQHTRSPTPPPAGGRAKPHRRCCEVSPSKKPPLVSLPEGEGKV